MAEMFSVVRESKAAVNASVLLWISEIIAIIVVMFYSSAAKVCWEVRQKETEKNKL